MNRLRIVMLGALAAAALAVPGIAQERREIPPTRAFGQPHDEAERTAVEALIVEYKRAWGAEDADALVALHSEDTEWINAYARMFRGSEALGEFLEHRLFPAFDAETSREEAANMQLISIRYIGDDAAVVHLYTDGHRGASRNAGEDARRTHLHLVLGKQEGGWKIVHTAIMDAR